MKADRFEFHKLPTKEIRYIPFIKHQCKIKALVNKLIIQEIREGHDDCNLLSIEMLTVSWLSLQVRDQLTVLPLSSVKHRFM